MTEAVLAVLGITVFGNMMVVEPLVSCALFPSVCDLKTTKMNVQSSLIRELMFNEFKVGHNSMEGTKNVCCVKVEGKVDHSTITA